MERPSSASLVHFWFNVPLRVFVKLKARAHYAHTHQRTVLGAAGHITLTPANYM
jgi:hypothetical protein